MQILLIGAAVLAGLAFLAVAVVRFHPCQPAALRVPPTDRRPGWRVDPVGTEGYVRFWDGSRWALDAVRGDAAEAAGWTRPKRRFSPTAALRVAALAIIVPLMLITPLVTLAAFAISRMTFNLNLGGSNK